MPIDWMDVKDVSFNALLLFERVQLSWLPGWNFPEPQAALALEANPAVAWYARHKCPEISGWVDAELARAAQARGGRALEGAEIRQAELAVLERLVDLLVYALDPAIYDGLPFLGWDSRELSGLVDFSGARVIDVGAGTGRLAFSAAELAQVVWAVEPVGNLRRYMLEKAAHLGRRNVYAVDGTITALPFPDGFADVTLSGHVYGDDPQAELAELERVTRPGGRVILCPGNNDVDDAVHAYLVEQGYAWSVLVEPPGGRTRKYWKTI